MVYLGVVILMSWCDDDDDGVGDTKLEILTACDYHCKIMAGSKKEKKRPPC